MRRGSADPIRASGHKAPHQRPDTKLQSAPDRHTQIGPCLPGGVHSNAISSPKPALRLFAALLVVVSLAACAETRTRESTGQYVDSAAITTKVKTAILQDPDLKVLSINVTTFKGKVQLSGFVDTAELKTKAGKVAASVEGVRAVENDLEVK